MSCEEKNNKGLLLFLKKISAIRYLKEPVFTASQLYEKYPDGNEAGTFAFVISELAFYGWNNESKAWQKIGGGESLNQSDWNQVDLSAPDYIRNKPNAMEKNVYDSNNNGIVDNSDKLEGKTLEQILQVLISNVSDTITVSTFTGQPDLTIWRGYREDFDAISEKNGNTLYIIKKDVTV